MSSCAVHVLRKELKEMLRDRRVVYSALFGPIFLVLLFLFLFGFLQQSLRSPASQTVHVVSGSPAEIVGALQRSPGMRVRFVASMAEGKKLVERGEARIVLGPPDGKGSGERAGARITTVAVTFDEEQPSAQIVLAKVQAIIGAMNKAAVGAALESRGLPAELAEPVRLKSEPIQRKKSFGGILASLLPYLVVIWAFYGGFSFASDTVAGEKERQTLETLLVSPADRRSIAFGKFGSLTILCATSGLSSLLAVALAAALPGEMFRGVLPNGFGMSALDMLPVIALVLPLSAFFAGLLLAVSSYSRNTRECQSYLTLVSFIVLMPAVFSQFIGFTQYAKQAWVNWVPILNSANVLRSALQGQLETGPVLICIAVNLALAFTGIALVIAMFRREGVIWRT